MERGEMAAHGRRSGVIHGRAAGCVQLRQHLSSSRLHPANLPEQDSARWRAGRKAGPRSDGAMDDALSPREAPGFARVDTDAASAEHSKGMRFSASTETATQWTSAGADRGGFHIHARLDVTATAVRATSVWMCASYRTRRRASPRELRPVRAMTLSGGPLRPPRGRLVEKLPYKEGDWCHNSDLATPPGGLISRTNLTDFSERGSGILVYCRGSSSRPRSFAIQISHQLLVAHPAHMLLLSHPSARNLIRTHLYLHLDESRISRAPLRTLHHPLLSSANLRRPNRPHTLPHSLSDPGQTLRPPRSGRKHGSRLGSWHSLPLSPVKIAKRPENRCGYVIMVGSPPPPAPLRVAAVAYPRTRLSSPSPISQRWLRAATLMRDYDPTKLKTRPVSPPALSLSALQRRAVGVEARERRERACSGQARCRPSGTGRWEQPSRATDYTENMIPCLEGKHVGNIEIGD
ncbi:hypothetical protein C8Q76DRAFT_690298 [Earliella scabrosa]|nr:hypothetical protein C8Q76DRAFT_690298 [Earliella scabrosa]